MSYPYHICLESTVYCYHQGLLSYKKITLRAYVCIR